MHVYFDQVRSGRSCHRYHATLCYLPHAEKENSVKNLCCLVANISSEKRLQELTSRRNLELESHRRFVVVINLVLATPATSMAPDRTGPAVPSGPVIAVERGVLLTFVSAAAFGHNFCTYTCKKTKRLE